MKIKEDGLHEINVERWGDLHIYVRNGCVVEITIYNSKKAKIETRKCGKGPEPANYLVNLKLENNDHYGY